VLISAHQCSSAYVIQSRDACLEKVEQTTRRGEEHVYLWGEGGGGAVVSTCMLGERGEEHMHLSSAVIRGHQPSSEVISGNHHPLGQPRDLHLPRRPPVHAGRLDAQGLTCGNSTRTQSHSVALRRTQTHAGAQGHSRANSTGRFDAAISPQSVRNQSAISPQSVRNQSAFSPRSVAYQSGGTRPRSGARAHGWAP
jgi:hypothetical protein